MKSRSSRKSSVLGAHWLGSLSVVVVMVALGARALAAGIPCHIGVAPDHSICVNAGCQMYYDGYHAFACCSVETVSTPCCIRTCALSYCVGDVNSTDCADQDNPEPGGPMGTFVQANPRQLVQGTNFCDDSFDPATGTHARCKMIPYSSPER